MVSDRTSWEYGSGDKYLFYILPRNEWKCFAPYRSVARATDKGSFLISNVSAGTIPQRRGADLVTHVALFCLLFVCLCLLCLSP
jgi:hypothetical protein